MFRMVRMVLFFVVMAVAARLPAEGQTWRTMTSARQLTDRSPLSVEIQYGVGTLTVLPADGAMLYEMELRYDKDSFTPVAEFNRDASTLKLGARSLELNRRGLNNAEGSSATIRLSRVVPLDLELKFGAGEADIDLGEVSLRRLSVSTGASETNIKFGSPNPIAAELVEIEAGAADLEVIGLGNTRAQRVTFQGGVGETVLDFSGASGNMSASVEIGVGSVTLRLPRDHGIRLNRSSFLASFTAPGLTRDGDSYYSSNWSRSNEKITIDVRAALGSVDIEWID